MFGAEGTLREVSCSVPLPEEQPFDVPPSISHICTIELQTYTVPSGVAGSFPGVNEGDTRTDPELVLLIDTSSQRNPDNYTGTYPITN